MNTSSIPTLAERLARVPNGALPARLSLARTRMTYSQTPEKRAAALDEIDAINVEIKRRNLSQGGAAAARLAHNQEVAGASPAPATNKSTDAVAP